MRALHLSDRWHEGVPRDAEFLLGVGACHDAARHGVCLSEAVIDESLEQSTPPLRQVVPASAALDELGSFHDLLEFRDEQPLDTDVRQSEVSAAVVVDQVPMVLRSVERVLLLVR